MTHDEMLSQVNEGRTASVTLNWMKPIFSKCEDEILTSLKSLFRSGKYDHDILVAHVAQLVAIETLQISLKSLVNRGESSLIRMQKEDEE